METASNDADYDDPNMFFEYWSKLAKTDPERFERERAREIEKVISQVNPARQKEIQHLQWRLDMERRRAKNPIDAMVRLNKMMWDQLTASDGFFSIPDLWRDVVRINNEMRAQLAIPKKSTLLLFKKD